MELTNEQRAAVEAKESRVIVIGTAGGGKAQPNNIRIPTPDGYKTIGELKPGMLVFNRKGESVKVLQIFPQGLQDNYRVTLSDGRTTYCNNQHLWSYYTSKNHLKTVTLDAMLKKGLQRNDRTYRFAIPINNAIEYPERVFSIDPYVIGAFLGDGCCLEDQLTISSSDEEIVSYIGQLINREYHKLSDLNYSWSFSSPEKRTYTKLFFGKFADCIAVKTADKKIPLEYKYSSIAQRFQLLQGLMDTDGSISYSDGRYHVEFTNTSIKLIQDIQEVLWSLGYKCSIKTDMRSDKYTSGMCYQLRLNIPNCDKHLFFHLPRKKELALQCKDKPQQRKYDRLSIIQITKMPIREEMTCILIDDPEHLYLTNDYIVTHNTRVITERIRYLLNQGVMGSDIYAITHTNNAAQEMESRIGSEAAHVSFGTIHSLANKILTDNGIDTSGYIAEEEFPKLFELLQTPNLRMPFIKHLIVDEFQDISEDQFTFIFELLKPRNFFIAGDSRQAIYDFDGVSNYRLFESLLRDKQNTVYEITCNYRCLPSIVKFADDFLITMRSIRKTKSWCIREGIANIIETPYNLPDIYDVISNSSDKYSDWFVLARWNKQVNQISRYLRSKGIPVDNFKQGDKTYVELQAAIAADTVKVLTIHSAKGRLQVHSNGS